MMSQSEKELKQSKKKIKSTQQADTDTQNKKPSENPNKNQTCDQCEQLKDQMLRLRAEMENLRKRTKQDVENAYKFSLEKFIKNLLPILDTFDLAIQNNQSSDSEGIKNIQAIFIQVMEKENIEIIDPENESFNPEAHEAVTAIESKNHPKGQIVNVMQKGYKLNGRLIRPAMVCIAK